MQKIAVDAGFTCPNRDGSISSGGCTYCCNAAFLTSYCDRRKSITEQIADGKRFFSRSAEGMKYLVYFQAYSNTYAPPERLMALYEEALEAEDVVGIVVATRPDCVDADILDLLEELSLRTFVLIEYGLESCNDATLRRIRRGHDFACSRRAIEETHRRGIHTGAHIILGLPGESRDDMLAQTATISSLPIDVLKLHQLQIIRGTALAGEYARHPFPLFTAEEYIDFLISYIQRLREDIVIDRFVSESPWRLLIAPRWGIKPQEIASVVKAGLAAACASGKHR